MLMKLSFDHPDFLLSVESALADDPLYTLLSDSDYQRRKLVNIFSTRLLNNSRGKITAYCIGEHIDAAAVWSDLNQSGESSWYTGLICQVKMMASGSMTDIGRIHKSLQAMECKIDNLQNNCDNYLSLLFVDSRFRGKGLATQLVHPIFRQFDLEGRVCGVDTFNPVNLSIYQKYGFTLSDSVEFGNGVVNYQMIRRPTA
ncbi:GNAT family N-acetyltransferase [Vibrio kasasachensis]|uniref:GNAT family N-acetyltransferase n=1 Tax=Vibrio kasasachensis TaxID=2910248 RepID=UPI003D118DB6